MANWKVWSDTSVVSGLENVGKVADYADYLFRQEEYASHMSSSYLFDSADNSRVAETEIWKSLLSKEKRIDSRLQSRIILPLPNSLTPEQRADMMRSVIQYFKSINSNLHISVVEHQGIKKGRKQLNSHLHIVYSQRDRVTGKKDRNITHPNFIPNFYVMVKNKLQEYGYKVEESPPAERRERISRAEYYRNERQNQRNQNQEVQDMSKQTVGERRESERRFAEHIADWEVETVRVLREAGAEKQRTGQDFKSILASQGFIINSFGDDEIIADPQGRTMTASRAKLVDSILSAKVVERRASQRRKSQGEISAEQELKQSAVAGITNAASGTVGLLSAKNQTALGKMAVGLIGIIARIIASMQRLKKERTLAEQRAVSTEQQRADDCVVRLKRVLRFETKSVSKVHDMLETLLTHKDALQEIARAEEGISLSSLSDAVKRDIKTPHATLHEQNWDNNSGIGGIER